jgi:rhodanese-related sulfurtransferase
MVRTLLALVLGVCGSGCASGEQAQQVKQLSPEEVKNCQIQRPRCVLLDVREPRELTEVGAIDGYLNIPLSQLEQRLSEIPKDKTVVTICHVGGRAAKAAAILLRNGYRTEGASGMVAWKAKNYPVIFPAK